MNYILRIILIFVTTECIQLQRTNESVVNYYVELITNKTQEAIKYKFPTDARMHEASDDVLKEYGYFDFIIVGAGTAGCVVANILSEVTSWKVLLIEAGTYSDTDLTGIPSLWGVDAFTKFNWGFESIPQTGLGDYERKFFIPKGKGIGGSSLINGMIYSRGNKFDFQTWSQLLNNSGWNFENVLPYFKKLENFTSTNPYAPVDVDYHGFNGPLDVTQCAPPQKISATVLRGYQQLGYNITDFNGKQQLGGSIFQYHIRNGRRYHHEMAFIAPAKNRSNLIILDKSYVTKIKINNNTNRVEGVIYTRENQTYLARASKEVILSAGAISSPQILMLSGIGPKDHLDAVGIPSIQNLPVGKNLRDHVLVPLIFSTNVTLVESLNKSVIDFLNGEGFLTRPILLDAVGWLKTSLEKNRCYPDLEFIFNNISESTTVQKFYGWSEETYSALNPQISNPLALQVILINSFSKGSVKLRTDDPFSYPVIDPNILSDEGNRDIEAMYEGIQIALKLTETEAFRSMNFSLAVIQFPGCNHFKSLSKEYWYCYLRKVSAIGSHQVGTCQTGLNPKSGVVDASLRVFGVDGLRVADASVIPITLRANPQAAVTMVGRRVSDLIKFHYQT